MNFVIDLIVLAIIIITAFLSSKYGFVRTLIEIVGFVLIIFIVNASSTAIAEKIYDTTIESKITEATKEISQDSADSSQIFYDKLPKFIKDSDGIFGFDAEKIKDDFGENINDGVKTAAQKVSTDVIKPVVLKPLGLLVSIVMFFVLSAVVKILAKLINELVHHSFAKGLNQKLGVIIGIPKGIFIAVLFIAFIIAITNFYNPGIWFFTKQNVDASITAKIVGKLLPNFNIFSFIFNV